MTREAELELEIARLRHALEVGWSPYYINGIDARKLAGDALSAPNSTTALQELINEVERRTIERCAKTCQGLFDMDDDSCNEAETCAEAIRALPTENLKLEDL